MLDIAVESPRHTIPVDRTCAADEPAGRQPSCVLCGPPQLASFRHLDFPFSESFQRGQRVATEQASSAERYYRPRAPLSLGDPLGRCATATAARYPSAGSSGPSETECKDKLGKILSRATDLRNRLNGMVYDRKRLPAVELKQYVTAFQQRQRNLIKQIKQFEIGGCTENYGIGLPDNVYMLATVELRVKVVVE